jgi:hypothetical protein
MRTSAEAGDQKVSRLRLVGELFVAPIFLMAAFKGAIPCRRLFELHLD